MQPVAPPGPEAYGMDLDADSEDLTDEDVAGAVYAPGPQEIVDVLRAHVCGFEGCTEATRVTVFARRLRKPHTYTRATLVCTAGHRTNLVIRMAM